MHHFKDFFEESIALMFDPYRLSERDREDVINGVISSDNAADEREMGTNVPTKDLRNSLLVSC